MLIKDSKKLDLIVHSYFYFNKIKKIAKINIVYTPPR